MAKTNDHSAIHKQRMQQVSHATWVGIWVNLVLAAFKMGAGYLGNSRAVFADGIHSLADLITNIAVLVGVRYWLAPPDECHPYGHQKLESLISLLIGVVLGVTGLSIGYDAVMRIGQPPAEHVGSMWALVAALFSVVSKEILFHWTLKKGKESKSTALEASAWESRSDAISSIPTVIAVGVAMWIPQWAVFDAIAAILVAGLIVRAAWNICREAINTLLDKGASPELVQKLAEFAATLDEIYSVHDVRTRYLGAALTVDLHAYASPELSLAEADALARKLENALCSAEAESFIGIEINDAMVHIEPLPKPKSAPNREFTKI